MPKTHHIILGLSKRTPELIARLKKTGKREIYVIDYDQSSKVQERDGIVYLSFEEATAMLKGGKSVVFHQYLYGNKQRRKEK